MPHVHDANRIADVLAAERWLVLPGWLEPELQKELFKVACARAATGQLAAARIGRGVQMQRTSEVRGDHIQWLEGDDQESCVRTLLERLDDLRNALNRQLFLGLVETEAHFAHYPPGACYQRHIDRFRSDDARTLSAVIHLGEPWLPEHGGELRLYLEDPDGESSIDLPPVPGQLVLFLSGEIEHEVLPTQRDRYSVAGWMRQRQLA